MKGGELRQWNDQHIYSCCNYHRHSCYRDPDNNQKCIHHNSIYMSSPCILCRIGWPRCPSGSPLDPYLGTRSGASTARLGCSSTGKPMGMLVKDLHSNYMLVIVLWWIDDAHQNFNSVICLFYNFPTFVTFSPKKILRITLILTN